jgi:hypothetical protein
MKRSSVRAVIALMTALSLLLAQHAAWAHLIGHAHVAAADVAREDPEHGAAESVAQACIACVAFTGADSAPTPTLSLPAVASGKASSVSRPAVFAHSATPPYRYRSRAPPLL